MTIESGPRGVSASSPPPHLLWQEIVQLIAESKATEQRAIRLLERIQKDLAEVAHTTAEHQKLLTESNLYRLVCGEYESPTHRERRKAEVFWHCVRAITAEQFKGFALPDAESPTKIVERTFSEGTADELFWGLDESREGAVARRYVLWSLARATLPILQNRGLGAAAGPGALFPADAWSKLPTTATASGRPFSAQRPRRYRRLHEFELRRLRRVTLAHLSRAAPTMETADTRTENRELFEELEKLLTRGAEQTVALEISLLLRVLCGRYLNPEPEIEEWWVSTLCDGVGYVLAKQRTSSGEWLDEFSERRNPLVHRYSPLVYLLDLGNRFLAPHLAGLAEATNRALRGLRRQLAVYDGSWSFKDCMDEDDVASLFRVLVAALSLGALAYDRFRDLLSDEILASLGATIPSIDLTWDVVPESLGFKADLEHGLIEKWKRGDPRRPGAILVYGPPGTGKTTIAKLIAQELNELEVVQDPGEQWRFLELTPADFAREGSDRIVACAEKLFSQLRHVRRCVVLMDEMEEFLRVRSPDSDKESRLVTTAFLPLLQEVVSSREIILVVATNFVGTIDPAMTRRGRFDLILPLGPPGSNARSRILDHSPLFHECAAILKRFPALDESEIRDLVVGYTMGYSGSEIEEFLLDLVHLLRTGPPPVRSRAEFEIELWRMRTERVPTALSGRAGCNWRTFADEARRFVRHAGREVRTGDDRKEHEEYWKEPVLPEPARRKPASPEATSGSEGRAVRTVE